MNLTNLLTVVCIAAIVGIITTYGSGGMKPALENAAALVQGKSPEAERIGITKEQLRDLHPFTPDASLSEGERRHVMANYYGKLEAARKLNDARANRVPQLRAAAKRSMARATNSKPAYSGHYSVSTGRSADSRRPVSIIERTRGYKTHGSSYPLTHTNHRLGRSQSPGLRRAGSSRR